MDASELHISTLQGHCETRHKNNGTRIIVDYAIKIRSYHNLSSSWLITRTHIEPHTHCMTARNPSSSFFFVLFWHFDSQLSLFYTSLSMISDRCCVYYAVHIIISSWEQQQRRRISTFTEKNNSKLTFKSALLRSSMPWVWLIRIILFSFLGWRILVVSADPFSFLSYLHSNKRRGKRRVWKWVLTALDNWVIQLSLLTYFHHRILVVLVHSSPHILRIGIKDIKAISLLLVIW